MMIYETSKGKSTRRILAFLGAGMARRMIIAGVNSGTSADGIDVCIAAWSFGEGSASTEGKEARILFLDLHH